MFKKLIERIASVNDYVNPIVVRDMRKLFGRQQASAGVLGYVCYLILNCFHAYFIRGLDSWELEINTSIMTGNAFGWAVTMNMFFSVLLSLGIVCQYVLQNLDDEMFLITTITPRQYLHAYMIETFILTLFCTSLFTPTLLIIYGQLSNFISLAIVMLCGNVLVAQTAVLVTLSFIAHRKRPMQVFFIFLCLVWFFSYSTIMMPWFVLFFLMWTDYLGWQVINTGQTFGFVSIYILLPIGLLLVGVMAYKLSLYAFTIRKESIVKMAIHNILYYTLMSVVMALVYFCIAFVVFTFL
jgi:hypothetical protein